MQTEMLFRQKTGLQIYLPMFPLSYLKLFLISLRISNKLRALVCFVTLHANYGKLWNRAAEHVMN